MILDKLRHAAPFCEIAGTNDFINHDRLAATTELELIAARDAALARTFGATANGMAGAVTDSSGSEARYAYLAGLRSELRNMIRDLALQDDAPELRRELAEREEELEQARRDLQDARATTRLIRRSNSWKLTAPLRRVKHMMRRS